MVFSNWDSEIDVLADDLGQPTHWAYSINTLVGQYSMDLQKIIVHESIGNGATVSYTKEIINLILKSNSDTLCIMENVTVWPHSFHEEFMVFHSNDTGFIYLIDSRGIIFRIDSKRPIRTLWNYGSVKVDRKKSCYIINDSFCVYYRSAKERTEFERKSQGNSAVRFNKDFNRFMRNDARNTMSYLYLTAGRTKCGAMVNYFGTRGMKYELVPNILCDDDTVNIRIPLDDDNAARTDVQFLCAKYHNTYSIYGLPLSTIVSGLCLPTKNTGLSLDWDFSSIKGREAMIYSIVDTIRLACGAKDDYDLYKKSFAKIKRLSNRGSKQDIVNTFSEIKLRHPHEIISKAYLTEKLEYINKLLTISGNPQSMEITTADCDDDTESDLLFTNTFNYDSNLYRIAYEYSQKMFRAAMSIYESATLAEMAALGIKISRWKNESDLYCLVRKEYPDAVYQYQADWLGLQSLDIYIPSLHLGIEYQGEQHYRPIDFFGGEKAYRDTIERDRRKAHLCAAHNITLLYWKYDEVISKAELQTKLKTTLTL